LWLTRTVLVAASCYVVCQECGGEFGLEGVGKLEGGWHDPLGHTDVGACFVVTVKITMDIAVFHLSDNAELY